MHVHMQSHNYIHRQTLERSTIKFQDICYKDGLIFFGKSSIARFCNFVPDFRLHMNIWSYGDHWCISLDKFSKLYVVISQYTKWNLSRIHKRIVFLCEVFNETWTLAAFLFTVMVILKSLTLIRWFSTLYIRCKLICYLRPPLHRVVSVCNLHVRQFLAAIPCKLRGSNPHPHA